MYSETLSKAADVPGTIDTRNYVASAIVIFNMDSGEIENILHAELTTDYTVRCSARRHHVRNLRDMCIQHLPSSILMMTVD